MTMTTVPAWAIAPQNGYPAWHGVARHYRFDGDAGLFFVGDEEIRADLWVQIFMTRWEGGLRWGRQAQEWLDVAFVDSSHVVSQLSLKKSSAVNVQDYLIRLENGQIYDLPVRQQAVWCHLVAEEKRTKEDELYWVVAIEASHFASEGQFNALTAFAESAQFEWHFPGEITPQELLV
ncbi:hypothetical protein [Vacuolonema iberomarrocanum]|uniref:hypothetical protein n=1 Tax=Vacuolonema iberomarrocanum TaxID=3454632 RepID=UPI0019FAB44A|nr:hypothetical protein [filamentous cyanobacterium LEGE 07170]